MRHLSDITSIEELIYSDAFTIQAYDEFGNMMWDHRFPSMLIQSYYANNSTFVLIRNTRSMHAGRTTNLDGVRLLDYSHQVRGSRSPCFSRSISFYFGSTSSGTLVSITRRDGCDSKQRQYRSGGAPRSESWRCGSEGLDISRRSPSFRFGSIEPLVTTPSSDNLSHHCSVRHHRFPELSLLLLARSERREGGHVICTQHYFSC